MKKFTIRVVPSWQKSYSKPPRLGGHAGKPEGVNVTRDTMKKFTIRVEETAYYNLSVEAESLEAVRQIAKDIKSYDRNLPDFVGGETPSSFGEIKTTIKEVK